MEGINRVSKKHRKRKGRGSTASNVGKDSFTYEIVNEVRITVPLLVECVKDGNGKIESVKEVVYPSEDEMFDELMEHLKGANNITTGSRLANPKENECTDDDGWRCGGFKLNNAYKKDVEKWKKDWKESLSQDDLCLICILHDECVAAEQEALKAVREGVSWKGENEKEGWKKEKKKDKPFRLCLD